MWDGEAPIVSRFNPPTAGNFATIKIPLNANFDDPKDALNTASTEAHEWWGHLFAGIPHEGDDLMEKPSSKPFFNDRHTQDIRTIMNLGTARFRTPQNEIKIGGISSLTVQSVQSQDMSLAAVVYTPTGTTQLYSEVRPYNDDGPGVPDYIGSREHIHAWSEIGKQIQAPQIGVGNYVLLPDMTYTWRVRTSGVAVPLVDKDGKVLIDDQRWTQFEGWPGIMFPNPAAEIKIKTPKRDSSKIGLVTLSGGQEINNLTPTFVWKNGDTDVFYYEVQVSKDSEFGENGPKAMVYHELRHGGVTNPANSYTIPNNFPLEPGQTYNWRVRPRVQGDGTPVAWSNPGSFKTSPDARVLSEGELEVITQAKKVISTEEYLKLQEQIRKEEQERNQQTALHWQQVNQKVLEDIAAYRREEAFTPAA